MPRIASSLTYWPARFVARPLIFLAALVISIGRVPPAVEAQDDLAVASAMERLLVDLIRRTESSVVSVARLRPTTNNPVQFSPFGGEIEPRGRSSGPESPDFVPNEFGTGVIVAPLPGADSRRFILTNYHVVRGGPVVGAPAKPGESQLYVRFADRRGYHPHILAADPRSDLAILAIDAPELGVKPIDLKPVRLRAESSPLQKGELVVALGNPYAIARDGAASATWGMISNISRRPAPVRQREPGAAHTETIHQFGTLLQVDTRMDLGTSGGALINLHGELTGLTTSLAALEGYEKSVGFAIPIDEFSRRIIETLCRGYEVEYGFLGLIPDTAGPDKLRRYDGDIHQASAARVTQVIPNSPAANAQLLSDDIILSIDGHPLLDQSDLMRYVGLYGPEAQIHLRVFRPREGHQLTLTAKLGKWPVVDGDAIIATSQRFPAWRGITVDYPTGRSKYTAWAMQFKEAVVVTNVAARYPAQAAGLAEGDFIASVGGTPVRTPAEFHEAVRNLDGPVTLELSDPDHRQITVPK